jgi:dihydrofolate reductase
MTTTLTIDLFVSADGWAGSADLPGYFGYLGPELEAWIAEESGAPQVVLMGRKTYQVLSGLPEEAKDEGYRQMTERETVVFSQTLSNVDWPNARLCRDDVVDETRRLKAESDLPLRTMGSLSLCRQLLAGAVVDRLRLMTFPLFAGPEGREWAFDQYAAMDLALAGHRTLDDRLLLIEYRPTGNDIPRA